MGMDNDLPKHVQRRSEFFYDTNRAYLSPKCETNEGCEHIGCLDAEDKATLDKKFCPNLSNVKKTILSGSKCLGLSLIAAWELGWALLYDSNSVRTCQPSRHSVFIPGHSGGFGHCSSSNDLVFWAMFLGGFLTAGGVLAYQGLKKWTTFPEYQRFLQENKHVIRKLNKERLLSELYDENERIKQQQEAAQKIYDSREKKRAFIEDRLAREEFGTKKKS